jgi:hypothetical protein
MVQRTIKIALTNLKAMRKVFSSHGEVCHVWASRSQEEGTSGNISFRGDSIYSYHWWEMARFYETKSGKRYVFIRDRSYSSSTGKHMGHVRGAIPPGWEAIRIPGNQSGYFSHSRGNLLDHEDNVKQITDRIKASHDGLKNGVYPDRTYRENQRDYELLKKYCRIFRLKVPAEAKQHLLVWDDIKYYVQGVVEKREQRDADREYKQNREHIANRVQYRHIMREIKPELDEKMRRWRAGETNDVWVRDRVGVMRTAKGYHLRVKDEMVESDASARVPIREAKILWSRIKAGKDIKGFRVGHYTVIGMNGELKIGCHTFDKKEIKEFTEFYNW